MCVMRMHESMKNDIQTYENDMNGLCFVILNMINEALILIRTLFAQSDDSRFVITLSNPSLKSDMSFPGKEMLYTQCKKCILRNTNPDEGVIYLDIITATKSYTHTLTISSLDELMDVFAKLFHLSFRQCHVQTPQKDLYLKFPKAGKEGKKLLHHFARPSKQQWTESDEKDMLLHPRNAGQLLYAIGICDESYSIIPAMRDKYVQINHFIRIFDGFVGDAIDGNIHLIDCGCGQAYVSFAMLWYLREIKHAKATLTGIERNPELISSCRNTAQEIDCGEYAQFLQSSIQDIDLRRASDERVFLIALHACDTATDDALALALRLNADIILAAPCCHHYVQEQMDIRQIPPEESFLIRDGIMRERLGDMLTDSMRRDILISRGYSSDLIEFTPLEHTAKNVMIRAKYISNMPTKHKDVARRRFEEASKRWHVVPKLHELIKN